MGKRLLWENVFIVPGMKAKPSPQTLLIPTVGPFSVQYWDSRLALMGYRSYRMQRARPGSASCLHMDTTGSTRFRGISRPVCFARSSQTCRLRKVLTDIFGPTRRLLRKVLTDAFKSWFEGGVCTWMPPGPPMTDTHTPCGGGKSDVPNYAINAVER